MALITRMEAQGEDSIVFMYKLYEDGIDLESALHADQDSGSS